MKQKLLTGVALAAVAALIVLFASPSYRQGEPSPAGRPAPDFAFELDGRPSHLADLRGRVVVLNFWATWCPPCVEETPSLNRLQQELAPLGATVLGISVDEDDASYRKFLADNHVNFPTYRDPSRKIPASYGTATYPETYIVDRSGRITRKLIGAQEWDSSDMVAYLKGLTTN